MLNFWIGNITKYKVLPEVIPKYMDRKVSNILSMEFCLLHFEGISKYNK